MAIRALWRRLDTIGLELFSIESAAGGHAARGLVLSAEAGGIEVEHAWRIDADWHAHDVEVTRRGEGGVRSVRLQRRGQAWLVDGMERGDLAGCVEADLSATPFCNTLPFRALAATPGSALEIDVAYIDAVTLTVTRSRQRYERTGPHSTRYVDLGVAAGFEARIEFDIDGLVSTYENLFERITAL